MRSLNLPDTASWPRRLIRPGNGSFKLWISLAVFAFWIFIAIFGGWLAPYGMGQMVSTTVYSGPSHAFWLGTDYLGRDVLSRILIATRYTVGMALISAILSSALGASIGILTSLVPRAADVVISRIMDAFISIPSKMMALLIVATFGSSVSMLIVAMVSTYAPGAFRITRSLAINHAAQEYIIVARCRGEKLRYIAAVELLPNIFGPILTDMGLRFVFIVILLSAMGFLGLGVQPPMTDLGSMVHENIGGLSQGALAVIAPALSIGTLAISANLLIDALTTKGND